MTIRAVLFDIGGVLLTLGEAGYRAGVARLLGLDSLGTGYEAILPALQRGEVAEAEVWARLAGRPVDVRAFDVLWLEGFVPVPDMVAEAAELRALGLRAGILSNTQASHVRLMREMGFLAPFDPVLLSLEVGCRKPEPAVLKLALERLGLPAEAGGVRG